MGWGGLKQREDEVGWERAENVGVLHEKRGEATAGESAATVWWEGESCKSWCAT